MGQAIGDSRVKYRYSVEGIEQMFTSVVEMALLDAFPPADPEAIDSILATILHDEKEEIKELPPEIQTQLLVQHEEQLKKYKPPPILPNEDALQELLTYLKRMDIDLLEKYAESNELVEKLTNFLQDECEGDNDCECLILNIFNYILQSIPEFEFNEDTLFMMCQVLNPYHIVNACLILDIFTTLCWRSDTDFEQVINIFGRMKDEKKWKISLAPLLKILQIQKNLFAIGYVCTFITTLINAHSGEEMKLSIKRELLSYGIEVIYRDIQSRVNGKQFKIEDCTYQAMLDLLFTFHKQYMKGKDWHRKVSPPDDKPVELSVCSQECQDLFIGPDQQEKFESQLNIIDVQINAFLIMMEDVVQLNEAAVPMKTKNKHKSFFRQKSVKEKDFEGETVQLKDPEYRLTVDQMVQLNDSIRKTENAKELIKVLETFIEHATSEGFTVLTQLIQAILDQIKKIRAAIHFSRLKKSASRKELEKSYDQQSDKIIQLENEIKKYSEDKLNISKTFTDKIELIEKEKIELEKKIKEITLSNSTTLEKLKKVERDLSESEKKIQELEKNKGSGFSAPPPPPANSPPPPPPPPLPGKLITNSNCYNKGQQSNFVPPPAPPPPGSSAPPPPPAPPPPGSNAPPPPPPPPGYGGPPPPPPPPGFRGPPPPPPPPGCGGPPPPPPPPGAPRPPGAPPPPPGAPRPPGAPGVPPPPGFGYQRYNAGPQKQKCQPSVPCKSVNWSLIKPNKISGTVWEKVDDQGVEYDKKQLEELFCRNVPKAKETIVQSAPLKPTKPVKTSYLTPDRQKNVELILFRLKISATATKDALFELNFEILTQDKIEMLKNAQPEKDEIDTFLSHENDDKANMAVPDLFFIEICQVPQLSARIEAVLVHYQWRDLAKGVEDKLKKFEQSINLQRKDQGLLDLMKYTLAIGNYLNGTNSRGGAFGFKIDALCAIDDVRAQDGKRNLMMYIIEKAESDLGHDLQDEKLHEKIDYEFVEKFPLQQLSIDINELKKMTRFLDKAIKSQSDNPQDKVEQKLSPVSDEIKDTIENYDKQYENIQNQYKELQEFFCEDTKTPSEQFFQKIHSIWNDYQREKVKLKRLKLSEQKALEKKRREQHKQEYDLLKQAMTEIDDPDLKQNEEEEEEKEKVPSYKKGVPMGGLQKSQTDSLFAELRKRQESRGQRS